MLSTAIPPKFPIPFANSAGGGQKRPIPVPSQTGIQAGAASLTDGFPPKCLTPVGAGGVPPFGQDMNGLMFQVTQWLQWLAAGGLVSYDAAFSTAIGGYPKNAVLAAASGGGATWVSTVENNTTNPDAGGAGWISSSITGGTTGDVKWRPTNEDLLSTGWIRANATTIGNSASGASQLADITAQGLYIWHWTNFSNTQCPVAGGRGGSAAADFAANKAIQVLDMRGCGAFGMDTMGGAASTKLVGVPATFGDNVTAGSNLGENRHSLTPGEAPGLHPGEEKPQDSGTQPIDGYNGALGAPHNTVPNVLIGSWYIKL